MDDHVDRYDLESAVRAAEDKARWALEEEAAARRAAVDELREAVEELRRNLEATNRTLASRTDHLV